MSKENKYGEATVGYGSDQERKVPIMNWISAHFKDGRKISIIKMEDNKGYAFTVENHESSDRSTKQQMWLTEESFIGLFSSMSIHMSAEGIDFQSKLEEAITTDEVEFNCSDNLTPDFSNKR